MFKARRETADFLHLEFFAPESANALSLEAARQLSEFIKSYKHWQKPVLVSSAHERMFCSGGHLSDYQKLKTKAAGLKVNREIAKVIAAFAAWTPTKLALIEGDVLGGGVEWLSAFDYRWSTPNALFAFWQRRLALSTGWSGGSLWSEKIGEETVRKLLLEARLLSAEEANTLGLVDRIVIPWRLYEEAEVWAARLSKLDAPQIRGWSREKESALFDSLWLGKDHKKHLARWKA